MQIPHKIAFLNGQFAPLVELKISVMDRGFLLGDGVYEMIPVYQRVAFRLDEHLARLAHNLAQVSIENPYSMPAWREHMQTLIQAQTFVDQSIYLQVSRGPAYPRQHAFPLQATPTVLMFADPLEPPPAQAIESGVSAITCDDLRWQRCNIKAISLLANVLAKQEAVDAGVAEAILLRDGVMLEGAASNIFIVKDAVIYTPAPSNLMLTGITYDVILELARQHALPLQLERVTAQMLREADEVWLTSSSKEILAIVNLDGQAVGNGQVGPIYKTMYGLYQDFKMTVMHRGQE